MMVCTGESLNVVTRFRNTLFDIRGYITPPQRLRFPFSLRRNITKKAKYKARRGVESAVSLLLPIDRGEKHRSNAPVAGRNPE